MDVQLLNDAYGKVLVIDDNPIIQRAVYFALREKVRKVLMCGDVSEALHIVREENPDLIILDIHFPPDALMGADRDGFWALDWLHRVDEAKGTPVIMISSDDAATTRPRALAAGADAFLQKPLNKTELTAIALNLIAQRRLATAG
jgi:twitching motility two-component system response regulator PilG